MPGPGLVMLAAGLLVLSQQYEWAERRLRPVELAARRAAAQSVQSWGRILGSVAGVVWLAALGVVWILQPDAPDWWPVDDGWWLFGGPATGATLVVSALLALGMIIYSYLKFRGLRADELDRAVEADASD